MPLINLIQEQRLGSRLRERKARAYFFAFAGVTIASVLGFGALWVESGLKGREEEALKKQVARLEPMVKAIDANNQKLSILSPRLTTLEDAQVSTDRWTKILDHLAHNTPKDTWLTNVRCVATDPTKPVVANFTGITTSQDSVGDFLIRLQSSPDLQNVTLKLTQEKLVDTKKAIEFEISAELAGTAQEKPKLEKKESA
jgi:Tfp pilus assembly protein PilN